MEKMTDNIYENNGTNTNYYNDKIVKIAVSYPMMEILDYMDKAINNQTKIKIPIKKHKKGEKT